MTPQELIECSDQLMTERYDWEQIWSNIARLVLPMQDRHWNKGTTGLSRESLEGWASGPKSVDRLAERFDITGLVAVDRLATGLLSLVTPDNEKWMDLGIADPLGGYEASDEETRWLERQRDYLLNTRYNPLTGWTLANKYAMRGACAFGTGLYLLEEAYGRRGQNEVSVPYVFTALPLSENYLTVDGQGHLDNNYRRYSLTARQCATLFGTRLSGNTLAKATDPKKWHERVDLLHWVGYRKEKGYRNDPLRNSPVESVYIEVQAKHEIRRGGFSYWPIISYVWNQVPGSPYGESPVMLALAEIKSANVLAKNALLSAQQHTRPPVATMDDNTPRPNLNPGAINYGQLDSQGRPKIAPLLTASNPSLVEAVLEASRNQIKEGLYTTLWQILIQNPQMTATEALIRANEKAELLGPIGTNFQMGLARLSDAEMTILEGKGAWRPGAALEPPQSLSGKNLRPKFNAPLDRLRRSGEALGIARTLEGVIPLIEAGKTQLLDRIDEDEVLKTLQEVNGAPKRMLRSDDEVAVIREQNAQMQQASQMAELAKTGGEGLAKGLPAAQQLGNLIGA